ncbi:MAG: restriction endonuclease subunit S [bacterium]
MVFSIIQKSQIEDTKRLDAEYYQPEYLEVEKKLKSINTKTIGEISDSVVNFGAYSLCNYIQWQDGGVPYLNVQDIKDGYIDFDDTKFIGEKVNEILKKSEVSEGQVILTMAGTIGNAAVAHKIPLKVNSNQATAKITLKKEISPYFLTAFLGSYYGKNQIIREIVSSVQPNIFLFQIKNFKVPIATQKEQKEIEKIYIHGLEELENSKLFYRQAENSFFKQLNLQNFKNDGLLSISINLADIKIVNRFDAEYFNSPSNKMLAIINKGKIAKLSDLVEMTKGVEPGAEAYQEPSDAPTGAEAMAGKETMEGKKGKLFIRVSSISKDGIINKDQKYISEDLYNEYKKDYQPQVGEILLTKDASPGIACLVREPIEGIVASGVMRLKIKEKINLEYLTLVLNSIVGRLQAERDAGGSIIVHWKPEQIKNLVVPILPVSTQNKIGDLISQSYQARKKAKELLEEAKLKVEEMIVNNQSLK